MENADFSGYATKAGLKCADGRTIMPDAFKHQDKVQVPLVWQHGHHSPDNILGHAILEARPLGIYAYGFFNSTPAGQNAKILVQHKDINWMSIHANELVERAKSVFHGIINEVSLVIRGANPGAKIDYVQLSHGFDSEGVEILETLEDSVIIYSGMRFGEEFEHADGAEVTGQEVYDSLSKDQKDLLHYMLAKALESKTDATHSGTEDEKVDEKVELPETESESEEPDPEDKPVEGDLEHKEGTTDVTKNVFDKTDEGTKPAGEQHVLTHDAMQGIFTDAEKRTGSLKAAMHDYALKHGIENIGLLFPEAKSESATPDWDKRRTEWVAGVLNGVKKLPFSRVRNRVADLTQDEARAKGYIKGEYKKEQWFNITTRTTGPKTIYKKQKLDRDDILDITDFDVAQWVRGEMRGQLDEEIATAILIGDGREVDDPDKIPDPGGDASGDGIRSILNENEMYATTVNINIDDASSNYYEVVEGILRARKYYRGSGSPTAYMTEDTLTEMLLLRDGFDRRRFRTVEELASELRVASIVTVETMEREPDVLAIIVNLMDYSVGTDRGGEVNWFDDFDIDYNKYTYLIEGRMSGSLNKIKSALVIKKTAAGAASVTPNVPTFVASTGVVTIVATTGVVYKNFDTDATLSTGAQTALDPGETLRVKAVAASGSYFIPNTVVDGPWTFKRPLA